MSNNISDLEPKPLWKNFSDLNAVPRPSKKEERVIKFMQDFGKKLNLPVHTDKAGNVIITKPASKGMENRATVVLQSHLDMVHQKNADTSFDFDKEGIKMFVDGDWVKAQGTTLGADNGIGVATIMAVLQSTDIVHLPIEALFTIDEETGMTGALELQGGLFKGSIMLNLDTEDDNELTIGCAGGVDVTATGTFKMQAPRHNKAFKLMLKGLSGGHSGMNIIEGRANANKLMNRMLLTFVHDLDAEVSVIDGGSLRNAIPRESFATLVFSEKNVAAATQQVNNYLTILKQEYKTTDPNLTIVFEPAEMPGKVIGKEDVLAFMRSIYSCPNGIYRMSPDIAGLVQTSNNIARVLVKDGEYQVQCLSRSSVDSEKADLQMAITSAFELCGAQVAAAGSYPGWTPDPNAPIVKLMSDLYTELFKDKAHVSAVHAGLECGILGRNYPGMQMISFGPNIRGAHSPDEKVQISSVQKFWKYFLETLKRIPATA